MTSGTCILIMGAGAAARRHTRLLSKHHPDVRLVHWNRSDDATFAGELGGRNLRGSWQEAVATDGVDAVFVTTPPCTHRELALAALAAGKHVIVEKPAFLDTVEFDEVDAAADRAGRHVLVAENYAYKPLLRHLRALVESGALGQVRLITINAAKWQAVDGWRSDPAQAGGGALFEGGVHWVSLLAGLGLTVSRVDASFPDAPAGQERSALLMLEFEEGAAAVLAYSWEIPTTLRGLRLSRIHGTKRSVLFESNGLFTLLGGRRLAVPGLADIQGYRAMLADFVRVLTSGGEPRYELGDARRDVALIRMAYGD
jgi:predicted dehydrogenase